jgi:transglutaminase-like putative cysteine protease
MSTKRRVETTIWDKLRLEEGWFSLFALFLAFMIVVWSVEGAKWVDGAYLLPRAALAGFVLGLALAKIRFIPALLGHSFIISVGLVFVGLLVAPYADPAYKNDWSRQLGSTVLQVVQWFQDAITGKATDKNLVYLALQAFGLWLLGYLSAWLLFRSHRVWWTVALLGLALMMNLSFNPPNAVLSFCAFIVVALLLVVRFSAFMDEQRWRALRLYFQPGLWRMAMVVGCSLVAFIIAVAFLSPSASEVDSFGRMLDTVSQPFNGFKGVWDNFGKSGEGPDKLMARSQDNYTTLGDSFTLGGQLHLSNDPYFRVTGDSSQPPIYLQAKTLDEWDGKGWINTYQTPATGQPPENTLFRRLSLAANQSLPTSSDQGRATNRMGVTMLIPGVNWVLSLGDMVSTDRSTLVAFHYEKIVINAPLDSFVLKDVPDGNGGKRSVLVDATTGKVVPPSLLDLIKYLKDGTRLDQLAVPPTLTATYTRRGNNWFVQYRLNGGRSLTAPAAKPDGTIVITSDGWTYQLPGAAALQGLSLQPGGISYTGKLPNLAVRSSNSPDKTADMDSTAYLSSDNSFVVTLQSPLTQGNTARDRFEATDTGKQVAAEIKKLQDAVKGNKIDYKMLNGKPYSLQYEAYEPNYDDLTEVVTPQNLNTGETYTTYARRYQADVQSLTRASRQYPDWITDRYLKLPSNLSPNIKNLAEQLTAKATNPYDKAKAIEAYLKAFNYTDNPTPAPAGRDEIDYFLFETKSGYCTYFSTSMALMLRSIGIPTRVATGFIGGEYDAASSSWIVRGNALHAWTQAYFPGYGWVDFEPTPGRAGIQRPPDPASVPPTPVPTPAPAGQTAPNTAETPTPTPETGAPETPAPTPDTQAGVNPVVTSAPKPAEFPVWILWVAGIALLGAALYQARRIYIKRQFALPDPSPLVVYNRMSQSARRAGLRGRTSMTPFEYARYLGHQLPTVDEEVEAITRAYVRQRYGPNATGEEANAPKETAVAVLEREETPLLQDQDATLKVAMPPAQAQQQIRTQWESYQTAVLRYRRDRRLERFTPGFVRNFLDRSKK